MIRWIAAAAIVAIGSAAPTADPIRPDSRPVVWSVDGAGGMGGCSHSLARANLQAGLPIDQVIFEWSHGKGRVILDQVDAKYARTQGCRLAAKILERKRAEPGRRMAIVAHSAGSAVALAACEQLPPDTIDLIVLLAPSVSSKYDLAPALRAAREGMDTFSSKKDWITLGMGTRLVGTADRHWTTAAGRKGFRLPKRSPQAEWEACRVRQHFWSADVAWTGNTGRHTGVYAPAFLQAYVLPLITR